MDGASCAATVEKRVGQLPGVRRATVNFAAGRLDAEHDPGLALEEIEKAVREAGYGVESTQEAERPPFWRTPRAVSVRSEEHTSELQSRQYLVCRLLLEKKKHQ